MIAPTTSLSPMRIGEILDRSVKLLPKILFRPFVLLTYGLLATVMTMVQIGYSRNPDDPLVLGSFVFASFIVGFFYSYVGVYVSLLASELWHGRAPDRREIAKRSGVKLAIRFLIANWIVGLVTMMSCLPLFAVVIVSAALFHGLPGPLRLIVILTLAAVLLVPPIVYWCNRLMAGYILVLEQLAISQSIRRSKKLMTDVPGVRWYSFKSPLMRVSGILLILTVVSFTPGLFAGVSSFSGFGEDRQIPFQETSSIVMHFVAQLLSAFAQVFGVISIVGFYYDLRSRSEGYDLELACLSADLAGSQVSTA